MVANLFLAFVLVFQPVPDTTIPDLEPIAEIDTSTVQSFWDSFNGLISELRRIVNETVVAVTVWLESALDQLNSLPEDFTVQGGVDILPPPDLTAFGYAKWIISPSTVRELLGVNLAYLGNVFYALLALALVFVLAQITTFAGVTIYRFAVWVISLVAKLIPGIGA